MEPHSRRYKVRYIGGFVLFICLLFWLSHTLMLQWLLLQRHSQGEDKLLTYVTDLRRELRDFRFLPYTLADNPSVRQFLSTSHTNPRLQRQLSDIAKAAGAGDWYVLGEHGQILLSSAPDHVVSLKDVFDEKMIVQQLHQQRGESIFLTGYSDQTQQITHFVFAPVYHNNQLAGAIAVQVKLTPLMENWALSGDEVFITDRNQHILLANQPVWLGDSQWQQRNQPYQLFDGTRTQLHRFQHQEYLLQSVLLDDLGWHLNYLTSLDSDRNQALLFALFISGLSILTITIWLYRHERRQKIASKQENQRLLTQNAQLQRTLIEKTHVGLIQLSRYGDILFVNPTCIRYFGDDALLIGDNLSNRLSDADINNETLSQLLQLGPTQEAGFQEHEVQFRRSDNSHFPALLSLSPIEWANDRGYLVTLIDISKRKRAEHELKTVNLQLEARVEERTRALQAAQKELLRTEKLATIGQMSAAITHELNQPLTGIRNLIYTTELLLSRDNKEQAVATLTQVEELISRMHRLTSELKVLAYRPPDQLTPVSCQICFNKALAGLEHLNEIELLAQLPDDKVMAEPSRLERIFSNLLANAIDACHPAPTSQIRVSFQVLGDHIQLTFSDSGPVIEDKHLAHLFEPFYTSKPLGKGLGLGLAISANLARDMGGELTAGQTPSHGLEFYLTLRRAQ